MDLRYDTVSFLSDYGLADEFVGVTKSVIWSIASTVRIVDVTHGVRPHDVRAGGLALARAASYLNPGVVLAIVDPGVGTARKGVAIEVGDGQSVLVGPDNGVLAPAVALVGGASRAFDITDSNARIEAPGPTFDGRDLFAPVAASLAVGVPIESLGVEIDPTQLMPGLLPVSTVDEDEISAEVFWVDRFGNAQLNVDPDDLGDTNKVSVVIDGKARPGRRVRAFDEIEGSEVGLVIDSYGMIALAMARRSAAAELGLREGTTVTIRRKPADEDRGVTTPVQLTKPSTSRPEPEADPSYGGQTS